MNTLHADQADDTTHCIYTLTQAITYDVWSDLGKEWRTSVRVGACGETGKITSQAEARPNHRVARVHIRMTCACGTSLKMRRSMTTTDLFGTRIYPPRVHYILLRNYPLLKVNNLKPLRLYINPPAALIQEKKKPSCRSIDVVYGFSFYLLIATELKEVFLCRTVRAGRCERMEMRR